MDWLTILLLAAFPLMMLFCMKGMFSRSKKDKEDYQNVSGSTETNEIQSLQLKIAELMEQNHKLMNEVESIKETNQRNKLSNADLRHQVNDEMRVLNETSD